MKTVVDLFFVGSYKKLTSSNTFLDVKKKYELKNILIICDNYDTYFGKNSNTLSFKKDYYNDNKYLSILKTKVLKAYKIIKNELKSSQFDKINGIDTFELIKDDLITDLYLKSKNIFFYESILRKYSFNKKIVIIVDQHSRKDEFATIVDLIKNNSLQLESFYVKTLTKKSGLKIYFNGLKSIFNAKYEMFHFYFKQITPMNILKVNDPVIYVCRSIHNFWQLEKTLKYFQNKFKKNIYFFGCRLKTEIQLKEKYNNSMGINEYSNLFTFLNSFYLSFKFNRILKSHSFDFKYDNIFENFISTQIINFLNQNSQKFIWYVLANNNFYKFVNPKLIVNDHLWSIFCKATILVGRTLYDKQIIFFQHGEINKFHIDKSFYMPLHVNKSILWGKVFEKYFTDYGIKKEDLTSIGSPMTDLLKKIKSKIEFPDNFKESKKILFLPQPTHVGLDEFEYKEKYGWFKHAAKKCKDCLFIIKPHPKEIANYDKIFDSLKNISNLIVLFSDVNSLIYSVDIVTTIYSTTGYSALFLKKKLIILEQENKPARSIYYKHNVADLVTSKEKLVDSIKNENQNILQNKNCRQTFLKNTFINNENKTVIKKRAEIIRDFL